MSRLWKWIDEKNISKEVKAKLFLFVNSIMFGVIGLVLWVIVSGFGLNSWDWALCFIGYPGFFIGYIGGFVFLGRK